MKNKVKGNIEIQLQGYQTFKKKKKKKKIYNNNNNKQAYWEKVLSFSENIQMKN